jgi:acetyltransferase
VTDKPAPAAGPLPADYPAGLERVWQPDASSAITLRALRPDDLDRELDFIAGLSQETLHLRLQYATRGVSREEAAQLLHLDYRDTLAVAAVVQDEAGEHIIGVSRYARIPGTDQAECAIVVADRWQGRGLGTELMRSLGAAARSRGIRSLVGTSLGENRRILEWAQRFGFTARTEPNSGGLVEVTLDLGSLAAPS